MSRKQKNIKKVQKPDYKYGNVYVGKLVRYVMRKGKLEKASNIVYKAFDIVAEKLQKDPVECFLETLDNLRPKVQLKSRRVGSMTISVPMEISTERATIFALRWIIQGVHERVMKNAVEDLAKVIVDTVNKTGFAYGKKLEMHKQAEAQKVFSNYRW